MRPIYIIAYGALCFVIGGVFVRPIKAPELIPGNLTRTSTECIFEWADALKLPCPIFCGVCRLSLPDNYDRRL